MKRTEVETLPESQNDRLETMINEEIQNSLDNSRAMGRDKPIKFKSKSLASLGSRLVKVQMGA